MHLNFTIDGYPITFMGMIVVSLITSTLTTQFKRQSQILNEREKLLMEAEKETMRANLLRAVSHDLRTPLTSIIGMADTYLEQGDRLTEEEKSDMVKAVSYTHLSQRQESRIWSGSAGVWSNPSSMRSMPDSTAAWMLSAR